MWASLRVPTTTWRTTGALPPLQQLRLLLHGGSRVWRELRRLLDLKWAAVDQLPTERDREEALKMPTRPFPAVRTRFPLLQTPPIPNFAELKSRGKILFDD